MIAAVEAAAEGLDALAAEHGVQHFGAQLQRAVVQEEEDEAAGATVVRKKCRPPLACGAPLRLFVYLGSPSYVRPMLMHGCKHRHLSHRHVCFRAPSAHFQSGAGMNALQGAHVAACS